MGALLPALVGGLLTALAGLLGAWIKSHDEHRKWVRAQRADVYGRLVQKIAAYELLTTFTVDNDEQSKAWFDVQEHALAVSLVGPPEVVQALERMDLRSPNSWDDRQEVFTQMRKALGTHDGS